MPRFHGFIELNFRKLVNLVEKNGTGDADGDAVQAADQEVGHGVVHGVRVRLLM